MWSLLLSYFFSGSLQLSPYDQFGNLSAPMGGNVYRPPGIRTPQGPVTRPTRPIVPSNQWNSTQFGGFDSVQLSTITPPRASWMYNERHSGTEYQDQKQSILYNNQYQEQKPSILFNNQATAQTALYDQQSSMLYGGSQNTVFSDGWFCDLCNIALPTAIALNQVSIQ